VQKPVQVKGSRDTFYPATRLPRITPSMVGWFLGFLCAGAAATLYPLYAFGLVVVLAVVGAVGLALRHLRLSGLDVWQLVLLMALSGYVLLNYGFENLAFHVGGVPIIVSYLLMYGALGLAVYRLPGPTRIALQEPAIFFLLSLLLLTFLHLIVDLPAYGIWAIRDASMSFDAMFIVLGLLWARQRDSIAPLKKWLMVIFLLNSLYSLTLPWQEQINAWSPKSGVFLQIPLFGYYRGNMIFLLLGCLFYLFFGRDAIRWPRWIILSFAVIQLFGLAILQARAMYVGLVVVLVLLVVIGETKKSGKLLFLLAAPIAAIVLLTFTGIEIPGRIGPVKADFFIEHFRSISGAEDTPGATLEGRITWYDEVFARIRKNPWFGEGFGQPLITFENDLTGGVVRQPHNSSVTVLARLGIVGLLPWIAFHFYVMKRFVYAFRRRSRLDKGFSDLILWLFIAYLIGMIGAAVEAAFEFPSFAMPFYFFLGLALGFIRWQIPSSVEDQVPGRTSVRLAPLASS
jgi:O-antigen ligase